MKERPIIFSAPMVLAILEGRKTQTRRIIKDQDIEIIDGVPHGKYRTRKVVTSSSVKFSVAPADNPFLEPIKCPYGKPGDRLYVKETWRPRGHNFLTGWPYE